MGNKNKKMGNKYKKQKKRQRKEEEEKFPYLPEVLIYDILLRIPPELLFSKFRLVCRCWHDIISGPLFAEQLFNDSKSSIILQLDIGKKITMTHTVTLKEGKLDITLSRTMRRIWASCNGLLLTNNPGNRKQLLVCNPVTKSMRALPKCPSGCPHPHDYDDNKCSYSLAFDSSTNQYKVVHIRDAESGFEILNLGTAAAAAGSDKYSWRKVPWPSETLSGIPSRYRIQPAILVDSKVLHWDFGSMEYIMSMDVSEERPRETRVPCIQAYSNTHDLNNIDFHMVEMGGCLSSIYSIHADGHGHGHGFGDEWDYDYDNDDYGSGTMDIWILEDFDQGSWIKKYSIDMKCVNFMRPRTDLRTPNFFCTDLLIPLGCLENGELIVFYDHDTGLFLYDVRRNSMNQYFLNMKDCWGRGMNCVLHKNTLAIND